MKVIMFTNLPHPHPISQGKFPHLHSVIPFSHWGRERTNSVHNIRLREREEEEEERRPPGLGEEGGLGDLREGG